VQLLSRTAPDVTLSLDAAAADRAVAAGEPLLAAGDLAFDQDEVADELRNVAQNLSETAVEGTPAQLTATLLARTEIDVAALALPALPTQMWLATYDTAWAVSAAISAAYRPSAPAPAASDVERAATVAEDVSDLAVATGDEHAIKFVEVAQESHRRGNGHALAAAARAADLIPADD